MMLSDNVGSLGNIEQDDDDDEGVSSSRQEMGECHRIASLMLKFFSDLGRTYL